jgi:hypothetical protein
MDNYFLDCPAIMSDGRLLTDYRASPVREKLFRRYNMLNTDYDVRTFITDNGEKLINSEWESIKQSKMCNPRERCIHTNELTRVSTERNNEEILMYNNVKPNTNKCYTNEKDYRMISTKNYIYEPKPQNNSFKTVIARPYVTREL